MVEENQQPPSLVMLFELSRIAITDRSTDYFDEIDSIKAPRKHGEGLNALYFSPLIIQKLQTYR